MTRSDGSRSRGSGYRITSTVVLTAGHVVQDAASITVRFPARQDAEWVTAARVEWAGVEVDAALLTISPPADEPEEQVPATSFARLGDLDVEVACSTLGFPRFKLRRDEARPDQGAGVRRYRDSCHRLGRIAVLPDRGEGTLEIRVDPPQDDGDRQHSPWEGMAGAPVFVHGFLVGVVAEHQRGDGAGTLTAIRVDRWYARLDSAELEPLRALVGLPARVEGLPELPGGGSRRAAGGAVRAPAAAATAYDVFLSYNSQDLHSVQEIADQLEARGIRPFHDVRHLVPGTPLQESIETALMASEAVAVIMGGAGLGPWHAEEMRIAVDRAIRQQSDTRVIPVLLPGADLDDLPPFLARRLAVDLRRGTGDPVAMDALVAGVRGHAPERHAARLPDEPAPYPSLRAFDATESGLFFGRSRETRQLVERVGRSAFTAVVGASGSGKSSLVMAGLVPALGEEWLTLTMVPGSRPIRALADELATAFPGSDVLTRAQQLEKGLKESPEELVKTVGTFLRGRPGARKLLLVVDQFEELFTYSANPGAVTEGGPEFIESLCRTARAGTGLIHVVITLRADFIQPCLDFGELRSLLESHQLLLGPLDAESLREATLMPAQSVGALFERGLVDRILNDMRGRVGALPLMQTALAELWRRRRGVWLTHADYDAIDGIGGALNQLADQMFAELTEPQRRLARQVFLRLVTLGEGSGHTRRRVPRHELDIVSADLHEMDQLLLKLSHRDVRLVSIDRDTAELTHEALIDGWGLLGSWLRQSESDLRTHRQLSEDTQRWHSHGKDDSYLYRGVRLAGARDWADRNGADMSRLEADFLAASRAVEESAHARAQSDRTLARSGQAIFELESRPEEALLLACAAASDARELPLVQRAMFRVVDEAGIRLILRGHTDRISSVAWQRSGGLIATGSYDRTVRLWDAGTGRLVSVLEGHLDCVTSLAFDRSGERLVSGSWDGTARIWDLASLTEAATLTGHGGWVSSVTWSPSEQYIATGSQDNTGRIWRVATAETVCVLKGHTEWVRSVEWHPDERTVLTGSYDHTAALWSVPSGKRLATLTGHDGPVPAVSWNADGKRALTASEDGTLRLWDMTERTSLRRTRGRITSLRRIQVHTSPVYCLAWSPSDRLAATGSEDGRLRVFDVETGILLNTLPGHTGWVSSVAWSPDGRTLVSGSEDATARVTSTEPGFTPTVVGQHNGWVSDASWHPDGRLAATAGQDGVVRIWDTTSATEAMQLTGDQTGAVAWSPSGARIACGGFDGVLNIRDSATWSKTYTRRHAHDDRITRLAWSPDEAVLASGSEDGTLKLWDTDTWEEVGRLENAERVGGVAWSPEGNQLVVAAWLEDGYVWRPDASADDEAMIPLHGHSAALHAVDWSRSGRLVLTTSGDGTARIWDPVTGRQRSVLPAGEPHAAAFNPVRQQVVTASRDGGVRLWDTAGDADLLVTFQHPGALFAVAWRPDGDALLTGCEDGRVRLWKANVDVVFEALRQRVRGLFPDDELRRRLPDWNTAGTGRPAP
ncbi:MULTISPECIES: TIR domain-containing protein [unclassified Streptomyces]|uniref:nSTAND1 domain-containing NTPase n=1 Tax=unclassified Streptomyces TaxID=2593676 RepID=UPI001BE62ABC|nr:MULTISPECIES: TIR domain-containing protein [unclassified Streptomyces]MBT2408667.1 TIR domain-containing protein [Streptomyces sp. ISL-21]MBT2608649.1 TIR domain-containing protein [Streptomyces sp. ISL-87]